MHSCGTDPSDTLQHPPLVEYLTRTLFVWGGNIADKYGREAEAQCEAMGYPFVAVYMPKTRKTFQLVYANHGKALTLPLTTHGQRGG